MNNPRVSVYDQISWVGRSGFDFIDFSIEPPVATPENIDVKKVKMLMKKYNIGIVGHIGDWRLPKDSDYESVRKASLNEIIKAVRIHAKLGAKKITIHAPGADDRVIDATIGRYCQLIGALLKEAKKLGVSIMVENGDTNDKQNQLMLIDHLLKRFPKLGLHIDVGHSNIGVKKNMVHYYMKKYSKRIMHLHFSDNKGGHDDHKELGWGNIKWKEIISLLKRYGYDGTITVETFRSGPAGTVRSMNRLKKWWAMY